MTRTTKPESVARRFGKRVVCAQNTPADFWERVEKKSDSECWKWLGKPDNKGYGRLRWPGHKGSAIAPRVSFYLTHNFWPNVCRHSCDNPICVNPNHLLDGTAKDNARDRVNRGRGCTGVDQKKAKLSPVKAAEIRRLYLEGIGRTKLSKKYQVSLTLIAMILRNEIWKVR